MLGEKVVMTKRLKILVSAYACEPDKGSEAEVGWQWIQQLARQHDVCVLTRANNKQKIVQSGICYKLPNLRFEYVDLPRWAAFWKKGNRGVHLYYTLWQILAVFRGLRLHRQERFDLTHHLTFSPFYRAPLISLLPVPFIWGPIGAGEVLPQQYWSLFTFRQKAREVLRLLIRKLVVLNPLIYFAMRKARLIVVATNETYLVVPRHLRDKVVVESQIGMNLEDEKSLSYSVTDEGVFRIVTAGRHVYWKGHLLIIQAFAKFLESSALQAELVVLSDGPEHGRLKAEVSRLGIAPQVKFLKWLPTRQDVFKQYCQANLFAYCSFFECGGYVVLEAMACGTPVVTLQLGGPGEIVTDNCGVLVSSESIDHTVASFAQAFHSLAVDEKLLKEKKQKTVERVEQNYKWCVKGDRLLQLIDMWCAKSH
ncbi:MAG: glycosyltransferase family 4 protein [Gammaproteobacteria bacterium]|nr:glycosyltransferase family 4 protein [Gammaproteobacteria bacterium]